MISARAEVPTDPPSWVADQFGIVLRDGSSPVGLRMSDLIEVGVRRNPRRAQLLVSTVLGKHLAADPRLIAGMGRLLGALVARSLTDDDRPVPPSWSDAARAAVRGADPAPLLNILDAELESSNGGADARSVRAVLTIGFAETATSVGHLVADQLGSSYLHSTRRRAGEVPVAAEFTEPHSHATGHLLRPDPPSLLHDARTVVLVDDELSTGRTALNVIEALHALAPRDRYVLAGLVDVRSAADDGVRAAIAARLGCRIDVVSLGTGQIAVPADAVDRVEADMTAGAVAPVIGSQQIPARGTEIPWPAGVPRGGGHGFVPADRPAFDAAIGNAARVVAAACGPSARVLVLGTEELMYLPLRIALELARDPQREIAFQSTTRSPVHAIDRPGYPITRRLDFRSAVPGADREPTEFAIRHVYNCFWPVPLGGFAGSSMASGAGVVEGGVIEADVIVVVDDGPAAPGPDGVVETLASVTGTRVLHAVLRPSDRR